MSSRAVLAPSVFAVSVCLAAGCAPSPDILDGELRMGLFGQSDTGQIYRLRGAVFVVDGAGEQVVLAVESLPDQSTVISATLAQGDYSVDLQDGWFVERAGDNDAWDAVDATLVSPNPESATVVAMASTAVTYTFLVDGDEVPFGEGTLDIDVDFEETATGGGSGDDATTGDASCGTGASCVAAPPPGWNGPVLVFDGAGDPPPCPGAAPWVVHDLQRGLQADPAQCSCECADPTGLSCGAATLRGNADSCLQFVFDPPTWTLSPGACVAINSSDDAHRVEAPTLDPTGGSCQPIAGEAVPEADWEASVRSCELGLEPVACDGDGVCLPDVPAPYEDVCIWVASEAACPAGPYSEARTIHAGVEDDRGCSTCSCGSPEGECAGTVFLTDQGCDLILVGTVEAGSCGVTGPAGQARYSPEIDASCPAIGGEPVGEATATGPVTLCCLP